MQYLPYCFSICLLEQDISIIECQLCKNTNLCKCTLIARSIGFHANIALLFPGSQAPLLIYIGYYYFNIGINDKIGC